jgi:hypothetical protein
MTKATGAFVRAKPEHVLSVSRDLRDSDRLELAAWGISDVEARLNWALTIPGDARAVLNAQGTPVAIFGCAEIAPGVGSPWMLCARGINSAGRFIVRHGARRVAAWAKRWPKMQNATHAANRLHHRFIEHCGFSWVGETQVNGHDFKVFAYV